MLFSIIIKLLFTWLTLTFLSTLFKRSRFSPKRLPPGPVPFPVVGNLLCLGKKPHVSLTSMSRAHGDVFSLQLGSVTVVVVSSAAAAKVVLQKHDSVFANRAVFDSHTVMDHSESSIVLLPANERWRMFRKICVMQVFSISRLDGSRQIRRDKVDQLLHYVKDCCELGKAVNIGEAAFTTSLNFLTNTFFSMDMADPRSEKASELKQLIWGLMVEAGSPNIADFYPILKWADPQGFRTRMKDLMEHMYRIFDNIIDERVRARGGKVQVTDEKDVLDALMNAASEEGSDFQLQDIRHLLLDLFAAGTDTTSSTIEWAMSELLHSPSKLEKAQAEVREVIGQGNSVEESDSSRLPYLQAVIKETLRLHPPVPFLVPRRVDMDVDLYEYTVPKKAQVFVNVWAMGRDENVWKEPLSFEPERFLESEAPDYKGQNFEYLPFGAGRRICPGLPLGQRMLQLVLGSLLHGFDWKLQNGLSPEMMDLDDKFGFALQKANPLLAIPVTI